MLVLSWNDFELAVEHMVSNCAGQSFAGVYGVPRGGLVLAVVLSHRLELPLLLEPCPGALVVDDVYESGQTLAPYRKLDGATVWVWISKVEPQWWQAAMVSPSKEWIVFPWESSAAAAADEQQYRASRA
ncbi:MAG: phosphoribosyltransferase [Prochlorococcaceae cyanobacterium]|jgi:hypoxanthine phosphoribosyltransferase